MKKKKSRLLINHYFLRKYTSPKIRFSLINTTGALHYQFHESDLLNFVMVAQVTTNFSDVVISVTIRKIPDMLLADRRLKVLEVLEYIGISHSLVVLIWGPLVYEKVIRKTGVVFAHNRPEIQSLQFEGKFYVVQLQTEWRFPKSVDQVSRGGWNQYSPQRAPSTWKNNHYEICWTNSTAIWMKNNRI